MSDDRDYVWWTEDLPRHVMEIANASTSTPIKYEMLRDAAEELTKLRAENERLRSFHGQVESICFYADEDEVPDEIRKVLQAHRLQVGHDNSQLVDVGDGRR